MVLRGEAQLSMKRPTTDNERARRKEVGKPLTIAGFKWRAAGERAGMNVLF